MPRPILTVISNISMGRQGYHLSGAWESSVNDWVGWLGLSGLAPTTIRLRRDHVRSIARRSKTAKPSELTRGHLLQIMTEYKWSNEHRKGIRTSLNSFFEWCIYEGLADDNVARCLPKVRPTSPNPRPAPDHVWVELLANAAPRERLMALLAGEAGLRRAEVAQAHTDDVIEDLHGYSLVVHGKGGRQRVVPLTDRLAAQIRLYRPRGFLFPGQIDGHISAGWVGTVLSRLMPPGWSAHKLRHRFASRGYAGTGNLRAVQEALGHASVATTERYTAVSKRDVRSVSEAAGSFGRGAAPDPPPHHRPVA